MDSFFARNRLSAYLDRTLPKAEAEAVAEAVARDMALSADLRAMKQALTLLEEHGRVSAPTGFKARTMTVVAQQPVPGSQIAWLQRRLARVPTEWIAVLGAALVIIAAVSTGSGDVEQQAARAVQPERVEQQIQPAPSAPAAQKPEEATSPPPAKKPAAVEAPIPSPKATKSLPNIPFDPSTPMGFRILHGGDQVLYDIATLADETGGRLVNVHGKLVTPHSLSEARSFTQIYLVTPKETAVDAHKKLLRRSGMEPYPLDGPKPPLTSGEAVFLIEAQL